MGKLRKKRKRGSTLVEAILLSQMIANKKKKSKQRNAIIDSLNNRQIKCIGQVLGKVMVSKKKKKLPIAKMRQLIRDRKFINAIVSGQGSLLTRKKILKQQGGFLSILGGLLLPALMGM